MSPLVEIAAQDAVAGAYLQALNRCFPGWGDRETFDWCFRRRAGGPAADLLVVRESDALLAGSALTYRQAAASPHDQPMQVACMTGAWTLPDARGRGLFRALIDASLVRAKQQSCAYLIAFATTANASARALAATGAVQQPAWYCAMGGTRQAPLDRVCPAEAEAALRNSTNADAALRFVYSPEEWRGQMLERHRPVRAVRLGGAVALLEAGRAGHTLLCSSAADDAEGARLVASLSASVRPLLTYTSDARAAAALGQAGFSVSPGALFVFALGDAPATWPWSIVNGDRM